MNQDPKTSSAQIEAELTPYDPGIEPNSRHGGLRVREVAKKGTKLVAGHPAIHSAAEKAALAKLGNRK